MEQRCLVLTNPYWSGLTSRGCAVVTVERTAIEMIRDEHIGCQGVLDRHDRPVAVETAEDDVRDGRVGVKRLDDRAIEGRERDALPAQVGGGPPSHAVKVGGELSAGKRRELDQREVEGVGDGAADLDRGFGRDSGRRSVEVRTEAREPVDRALARGKRHVDAPSEDVARHVRSICRNIDG